ncbi:MAG: DEAD/DEAH box helicase [Salinivirgaceae bacterium]|nr:DEAD/DEAH box helicase [Salinivirgaceae bacterium]
MYAKKLNKNLAEAVFEAGFEEPLPTHKKAISRIKSGTDFICFSPEGSGKSSAIVLGVIQQLECALNDVPRAIIMVPDKQHALDLKEQFDVFGKNTDLRVFCTYNEFNIQKSKDEIYVGSDVVIGTAKRFSELFSMNGLNLSDLKMFIIDDAELVIRDSAVPLVHRMSESVQACQHIIFSEHSTQLIDGFAEDYMKNYSVIEIEDI